MAYQLEGRLLEVCDCNVLCPCWIGEDDPHEEEFLRGIWEEGDDRDFVLEALKGGVEVRAGRP